MVRSFPKPLFHELPLALCVNAVILDHIGYCCRCCHSVQKHLKGGRNYFCPQFWVSVLSFCQPDIPAECLRVWVVWRLSPPCFLLWPQLFHILYILCIEQLCTVASHVCPENCAISDGFIPLHVHGESFLSVFMNLKGMMKTEWPPTALIFMRCLFHYAYESPWEADVPILFIFIRFLQCVRLKASSCPYSLNWHNPSLVYIITSWKLLGSKYMLSTFQTSLSGTSFMSKSRLLITQTADVYMASLCIPDVHGLCPGCNLMG